MIIMPEDKDKPEVKAAIEQVKAENADRLQQLVDAGKVNVQPTAEDLADLDELERLDDAEFGGEG